MISKEIINAFVSGTIAYLSHLAILVFLVEIFFFHALISNIIGFCFGVIINFLLYAFWVIPTKKISIKHFMSFFIINLLGLILHSIFFYCLNTQNINYVLSQSISSILVFIINFRIYKNFIFYK